MFLLLQKQLPNTNFPISNLKRWIDLWDVLIYIKFWKNWHCFIPKVFHMIYWPHESYRKLLLFIKFQEQLYLLQWRVKVLSLCWRVKVLSLCWMISYKFLCNLNPILLTFVFCIFLPLYPHVIFSNHLLKPSWVTAI